MNKPLTALRYGAAEPRVTGSSTRNIPVNFFAYEPESAALTAESGSFGLADFRGDAQSDERSLRDYFLIGVLTLLAHIYIVQQFHDTSAEDDAVITPVKVPPMVQVTLLQPPKPIVEPPPPPPPQVKKKVEPPPPKKDVVALKPQKPKIKPPPKEVESEEPPPPAPVAAVNDPPPAPVKATPPAPPVAEKVTAPSASAGYLHNPAPAYPSIAEDRGWVGRVLLKVHVLPNGRPDNVTVQTSSGHDVLDQAAVKTVRNSWHFAPALKGNTPIDGWVTVPIVFNLSG
ncbi:energy transducer TonB [Candidatus Methylospira mobilis]|uniref:Energy transducer TonB n=1 Tax=Candidatus Methylospira mobilis TaxID=1808979 RepID=A0A5Q0BKS4_9GAMM|nr:energy transducer TonB [Candidatus Methylospira mobilis]QFY42717.1 energy transducer TonB [Candidatus Methylospira mobilis]WNV04161.1 energy transducer TonB [Candidatus Methylospira mobilis]